MSRLGGGLAAAGLGLLLSLFAVRLVDTAARHSLTLDEPHYVGTGLYLWESGDYHYARVLSLHPPLAYHLASLPLLFFDLDGVEIRRDIGHRLVSGAAGPSPRAVRIASRLPFVVLAVLGAALSFAWARELAGNAAGLGAAFLYTFSPMLLAHGALAHSDITVGVFFLLTLYTFWRYTQRPSPGRIVACGVALGLSLIAKLSALLLLAALPAMLALHALGWIGAPAAGAPASRGARLGRAALAGLGLGVCALAVFWVGYGGSLGLARVESGPLAGWVLPGYLHAFLLDRAINAAGRETYFLGEFSTRGWWYFFPVAFALKTPLGLLGLVGLALASARRAAPLLRFLSVPVAVYLLVACFQLDVPLGLRYLLPLYPPLFVFVAVALACSDPGPLRRGLEIGLAAWLGVSSLAGHPHYLSYFNALAGGRAGGPRYLLDSNVDWGQDLPALAAWLEERGNPPVRLAYLGPEDPAVYGIRALPLRGCAPVGGLVALSVNVRHGLYSHPSPLAPPVRGCYAWLDAHEPVARPGGSIVVYELPES